MERLSALLAFTERNPMVTGGFPHKGQLQSFDVSLDKLLNKQ